MRSLAPRTAAQLRQESKFLLLRISTAGPKFEIWLRRRLWAQTQRFGCWAQNMTLSTTLSTLWSWPALLAVLVVVAVLIRRKKDDDGNIPWATGAIPLLGHALAYKRDPASFITEQRKLVGDVFRLNLAGIQSLPGRSPKESTQQII